MPEHVTATAPRSPRAWVPGVDHLVVVAPRLEQGVDWCERMLGVTPGPGGAHPLMGTHNRLLSVASPGFPLAYLEVIAIEAGVPPSLPPGHRRWFDMDLPALQQALTQGGPQLVHWVARVPDLADARRSLAPLAQDPGEPVTASRATPQGVLQWGITLRPDGQRLMGACVPTLIQWGERHPTDHLPPSALRLQSLTLAHPQASRVTAALDALGLALPVATAPQPGLQVVLDTPNGPVTLHTPFI